MGGGERPSYYYIVESLSTLGFHYDLEVGMFDLESMEMIKWNGIRTMNLPYVVVNSTLARGRPCVLLLVWQMAR